MGTSVDRISKLAQQQPPTPSGAVSLEWSGDPAPRDAPEIVLPRAVVARPVPADADISHPHLLLNRELSWIDFNWRVLHLALDHSVPLLERFRFLAIAQSNLDEFFAKRVGGLKRQQAAGVMQLSPDGRTPTDQLGLIRAAVEAMQQAMSRIWDDELRPGLERSVGVAIRDLDELDGYDDAALHEQFISSIYPILTPLALDSGHPFPFISNLSQSLAVVLRHPASGQELYARVKVPTRTRWLATARPLCFVPVEEVVRRYVGELFPGLEVLSTHLFRVTRNIEVARADEEEASDLIEMIEEELRERRFAPVVRLELEQNAPSRVRELLLEELEVGESDVYDTIGLQDFTALASLANMESTSLHFGPWEPVIPPRFSRDEPLQESPDVFSILREGDVLVHHPYDSFSATVQRFIEEAAQDPRVLAIKQTLYRTSEDSPVVRALISAAEAGKQVAVLVEVTARLDEQRNIEWAQLLERAGVHVAYGVVGLKTHAKIALVVREEGDHIRAYCHVGTGNYHATTARLYTDLGLLTADPQICLDVTRLFHSITGYATPQTYQHLVVAPFALRQVLTELIDGEIARQQRHGDGRIIMKLNAIDDVEMIHALYRASRAGVPIDLIVRGHTRLRVGVSGYSDNIRLISIVGRFLEHDRMYCFANGGDPTVLIGSADLRRRNLEERIEAVVRIQDPALRDRLVETLEWALEDNVSAWELQEDCSYTRRRPLNGDAPCEYQVRLMERALQSRVAVAR